MSVIGLLTILLDLSLGLVVMGFGLNATLGEVLYLLRRPILLVRSILSMNIVMPVVAIFIVALFNLPPPLKIAIVALSLSPVPPFPPKLHAGAGDGQGYILSLFAVASILSIIIVPNGVWLIGQIFNTGSFAPAITVIPTILITIVIPLLVGAGLKQFAPDIADRIDRPIAYAGLGLIAVSMLLILFTQWTQISEMMGNGTLLILALFSIVGLAVGHYFGVKEPDRGVLAFATAVRHPGIALAIASATFPGQTAVLAIVFLHLVVGGILALGYLRFRPHAKHRAGAVHT